MIGAARQPAARITCSGPALAGRGWRSPAPSRAFVAANLSITSSVGAMPKAPPADAACCGTGGRR